MRSGDYPRHEISALDISVSLDALRVLEAGVILAFRADSVS